MKTIAKTTIATLLTAIVLSCSALVSTASETIKTDSSAISPIKGINKIWVSGNVKLILSQGIEEGINGTESYSSGNTSVLTNGQTLYINSTSRNQVTLNITLKDLQRIEAYGSSVVLTNVNFDVKYLQVFLNHKAKARLNAIAGSVYTVIKDDATLKMSGMANDHILVASNAKNVKLTDFVCLKNNNTLLADSAQLAGLAR